MTDTAEDLHQAAKEALRDFEDACRPHYCDGRFGAYRAVERDEPLPSAVERAFNAYHAATRAYLKDRGLMP